MKNIDDILISGQLCIQDLFERQQARTPNTIAVSHNQQHISYAELNRKRNILSNIILSEAADEEFIGISATKNVEMIIGLLAILKAGKAYLPLDLEYPKERLKQIIKDSGINTCLSINTESESFHELGLNIFATNKERPIFDLAPAINPYHLCVIYFWVYRSA